MTSHLETDTDICTARDGTAANHCDHRTNVIYTSNPPAYQIQCCYCGRLAIEYPVPEIPRQPKGHGPFAPRFTAMYATPKAPSHV